MADTIFYDEGYTRGLESRCLLEHHEASVRRWSAKQASHVMWIRFIPTCSKSSRRHTFSDLHISTVHFSLDGRQWLPVLLEKRKSESFFLCTYICIQSYVVFFYESCRMSIFAWTSVESSGNCVVRFLQLYLYISMRMKVMEGKDVLSKTWNEI